MSFAMRFADGPGARGFGQTQHFAVQLHLAEVLARSGETHESELEFSSAEKAFAKMGARRRVIRCGMAKTGKPGRRPVADASRSR